MKKDTESKSTSICYKKQILIWIAFCVPIILMLCGFLYLQFDMHNELKAAITTAERDIKAHASSDDLRASTNKILSKTDEAIELIKSMKDEVQKSVKIDDEKNKLLSNKYHIILVTSLIEKSILKGESFSEDLDLLKKFSDKKIAKEIALLSVYSLPKLTDERSSSDSKAPVDIISIKLQDALIEKKNQNQDEQTLFSKIHKFFARWFSIEKVDETKDAKDKNGYAVIASEMLANKDIDGAYFLLSKLSSKSNMKQVIADLKQLKEAINACKSIKDKVLLDD